MLKRLKHVWSRITGGASPYVTPASVYPQYRSLERTCSLSAEYRPASLVFVLPPVAKGAGGIADILHLGEALAGMGQWSVYYLLPQQQDPAEATDHLLWANSSLAPERILRSLDWSPEVMCATAWETVARAMNLPSGRKLYFVQDYEPWFLSAGVERFHAEATYHLGLPILTLGPWLAGHLANLGVTSPITAIPFPFSDERVENTDGVRNRILFYIQPNKRQRGSELLIETARLLVKEPIIQQQGISLVFFGSSINPYISFEFPCMNLGILGANEFRAVAQSARVGVSASFSNISLMPFRYLAHGAPCVELDLPNVRENIPSEAQAGIRLAQPDAQSMCRAICEQILDDSTHASATLAANHLMVSNSWKVGAGILQDVLTPGVTV